MSRAGTDAFSMPPPACTIACWFLRERPCFNLRMRVVVPPVLATLAAGCAAGLTFAVGAGAAVVDVVERERRLGADVVGVVVVALEVVTTGSGTVGVVVTAPAAVAASTSPTGATTVPATNARATR